MFEEIVDSTNSDLISQKGIQTKCTNCGQPPCKAFLRRNNVCSFCFSIFCHKCKRRYVKPDMCCNEKLIHEATRVLRKLHNVNKRLH